MHSFICDYRIRDRRGVYIGYAVVIYAIGQINESRINGSVQLSFEGSTTLDTA